MFVSETLGTSIVKKVAKELGFPLELVEKIEHDQWLYGSEAMRTSNSVEFTDLFTLKVKSKIVDKNIIKIQERINSLELLDPTEKILDRLSNLKENIKYLNSKKK